jgi:hypothetical protein
MPATEMLSLTEHTLTEHTLRLVDIAPYPGRRGNSAHDGMLRLMEVFGCVLPRR